MVGNGTKKKDSHNNRKYFETVCYKDCNGSLHCPDPNYLYLEEYTRENFIHFDRKGSCDTSGTSGIFNACEERKYTAFKRNMLFKY